MAPRREQVSPFARFGLMKAVTLPKWPVWLLLAATGACAYPAATPPPPVAEKSIYRALGQEPGWAVTIGDGRIAYVGDYGETRITVAAPNPRTTFNGHRYETERLIVDITHSRCNDAMSGHGYEDTVMVIADGQTLHGCGGQRRPDWDI